MVNAGRLDGLGGTASGSVMAGGTLVAPGRDRSGPIPSSLAERGKVVGACRVVLLPGN